MTDRPDDIFSPERLRHHWQQGEDAVAERDEEKAAPAESENVMGVFNRLHGRIHQKFPGIQGEALNVMLDELQDLLLKRFPQTGDTEISEEDKEALNLAIQELLNDVEDLVEALEL